MYTYTYKITEKDINEGNHVGNEKALLYFQYARTAFLKQFGLSQLNLGDNIGLIQTNAYVDYLNQLFLGEEISVKIKNIELNGLKLIFTFSISSGEKLAIEGYTTMLCYDYATQKVKRVPKTFLEILDRF